MHDLTLDKLDIDESALVVKINTTGDIRRRFFDMGLVPNTIVKCILKNSNMIAYLIRGAVVAIRKEDLRTINARKIII